MIDSQWTRKRLARVTMDKFIPVNVNYCHYFLTADVRQPWTNPHDCYFEYLIVRFDYLIIPFDYYLIIPFDYLIIPLIIPFDYLIIR